MSSIPCAARRPSWRLVACLAVVAASSGTCLAQARFQRITVATDGTEANRHNSGPAFVSADGRHVAFSSFATNLAPNDGNNNLDVFVRDRVAGTTVLISATPSGQSGNGRSDVADLSEDGRFVLFSSHATDFVAGDTNLDYDAYVCDRDPDANGVFDEGNATIVRASLGNAGQQPNGRSIAGSITSDGRLVAFESDAANVVPGDGNHFNDIFVRDLVAGTTERVNVSSAGAEADRYADTPRISRDGRYVAFATAATNLAPGDANNARDIYLRDRTAGTTERVSIGEAGGEGTQDANKFTMARDGQRFAWESWSDNLVAGDGNGVPDVFLRDRAAGTTVRASVSDEGVEGDRASFEAFLSANGEWLLFGSDARNLAGIETNLQPDVFRRELATGHLIKLSVHANGVEGDARSSGLAISDDGAIAVIYSDSFDLIGGDANGFFDLLVRDLTVPDPEAAWSNYGAGWPGTLGVPSLTLDRDPVMGTTVDLEIGNSAGFPAITFLYCGMDAISVPTRLGGTLLVDPASLIVLFVYPPGSSIACDLPLDLPLVGVSVFAQALQFDPGASRGISFSAGLEALLGQ
jgi:Tol biopolymer transport system component